MSGALLKKRPLQTSSSGMHLSTCHSCQPTDRPPPQLQSRFYFSISAPQQKKGKEDSDFPEGPHNPKRYFFNIISSSSSGTSGQPPGRPLLQAPLLLLPPPHPSLLVSAYQINEVDLDDVRIEDRSLRAVPCKPFPTSQKKHRGGKKSELPFLE